MYVHCTCVCMYVCMQCWGRYFLKVTSYLLLVTFPKVTRYSYILPQQKK